MNGSDTNNATQDYWESKVTGWFASLEVRQDEYIGFYPFEIDGCSLRLKESLNKQNYFYLLLLLWSHKI